MPAAPWWRRSPSRSAAQRARASSISARSSASRTLPLILWLLARALERASWRAGLAAGALAGLLAIGRDQVALLCLYVLAGYVLTWWLTGDSIVERLRASLKPLSAAALSGAAGRHRTGRHDVVAGGTLEPARGQLRIGRRRLDPSGASVAARLCRPVRRDGPESRLLGPAESRMGCGLGLARALPLPEHAAGLRRAHCRSWPSWRSA